MTVAELVTRLAFFNRDLEVVVQVGDRCLPITEANLNTRAKPTRLELNHQAETKAGDT